MRRVIIIGASSGIGRMLAEHYASQGCAVAIAARREENLKQIQNQYPQNVIYRSLDVTSEGADSQFLSLLEANGGADLVVYCSGAGNNSKNLELEVEGRTAAVNVTGFLNVIVPAFNYFVNRKEETEYKPQIVTISSVASFRGLGVSPAYSATKRFQSIYFEALAQMSSIKRVPVDFTAIKPGFIATDFIKHKYFMTMSLPYAGKRIIRAIEKRKHNAVIDWRWSMAVALLHLIPTSLWRKIRI
jgi:short-subunit dehydrogenase